MPDRLVLYTTVYPSVARYLRDWYGSVAAQTDREFDLWIGVDGVQPADVVAAMGADPRATWVVAAPGDTPTTIRARAIERMVERYDAVVFADSDDLLAPSRIAASRAALGEADVAACALRIMDQDARDLGVLFGPPPGADFGELLPRYNVFGLSNTTYRASVLRRCLPAPAACALMDWLLITRAWAMGATVAFDETPRMSYRQYAANVARVLQPFSEADVLTAAHRVLNHYECVLSASSSLPPGPRRALSESRRRARAFYLAMAASAARRHRYVEALNTLPPCYVWWWCVAHPSLEDLWRN